MIQLKAKLQKLETNEKGHLATIEHLKSLVEFKDSELDKLSHDNGEKENLIFELKERLEEFEKNSHLAPNAVAEG